MKILLHIGPIEQVNAPLQDWCAANRAMLQSAGVLFPKSLGAQYHLRLFMCMTDADRIDMVRDTRSIRTAQDQANLLETLTAGLHREIAATNPDMLLIMAHNFGAVLHRPSEITRLHQFLLQFSDDITVIAHVLPQSQALQLTYASQIMAGRQCGFDTELGLLNSPDWWTRSQLTSPADGVYAEVENPPFWVDYAAFVRSWGDVFGVQNVQLRDGAALSENFTDEIHDLLGLRAVSAVNPPAAPSARWLERVRQFNGLLARLQKVRDVRLSRRLLSRLPALMETDGPAFAYRLPQVDAYFQAANDALMRDHPALRALNTTTDGPDYLPATTGQGFRATQYLAAAMPMIEAETGPNLKLSKSANQQFTKEAAEAYQFLSNERYRPHNDMGTVNETEIKPPYSLAAHQDRGKIVIVACIKDEAPYILEWIAHHAAIGVDNMLIYSNNCSDGSDEMLDYLQSIDLIEHRSNDNWTGNSPQQHALTLAMDEPVVRDAQWVIHIDIDEFINIRVGNGTFDDLLAACPDATNFAMTWRMFGHAGITEFQDRFVTEQFTRCAPKFMPKPHIAWGFKTATKNIGAYGKINCHRPVDLNPELQQTVRWFNGSGADVTKHLRDSGWRSAVKTVGYDLVQLNHYAIRSAESFLIKRQRGRALHVDRTIGLNYWIRMDWNDEHDITIQRNLPRMKEIYDALRSDKVLDGLHRDGVEWHKAKARELRSTPEFAELYDAATKLNLTTMERAALALSLDKES